MKIKNIAVKNMPLVIYLFIFIIKNSNFQVISTIIQLLFEKKKF